MDEYSTKRCPGCNRSLLVDKFGICQSRHDGRQSYCKDCRRRYREGNANKIQEKKKADYWANRDKHLARHKAYYSENREQVKKRALEWKESHRDECRAYTRTYSATHPEWRREYDRQYIQTDLGKAAVARRRSKRRAGEEGTVNDLTSDQWNLILWLQGNECPSCNREFGDGIVPSRDHIVPVAKGGGLTFSNVQALCRSCNSHKHIEVVDYRGWWAGMSYNLVLEIIENAH